MWSGITIFDFLQKREKAYAEAIASKSPKEWNVMRQFEREAFVRREENFCMRKRLRARIKGFVKKEN